MYPLMKTYLAVPARILIVILMIVQSTQGQQLFQMEENIHTRWASPENPDAEKGMGGTENFGRKGRPSLSLEAGDTLILAHEPAGTSGTIRRIWMTIRDKGPEMQQGLALYFFWDGALKPAVAAPVGYFFGMGLGKMITFETALFSSPEGRSYNCYIPMPFKNGMKMILVNESKKRQESIFYDVDYTVGDTHDRETLYFHAYYKREDSTHLRQDYEFLPYVKGKGRFLGVHFGVMANQELFADSWWGEGEVKVYLDGDQKNPTLCGTGTEDYIGTGWGQGKYDHAYQGCHLADHEKMQYCFYRYHIPDPVYFHTDIRATIHQIGCCFGIHREKLEALGTALYETGNSEKPSDYDDFEGWLFERYGDDWASCVYFYLDNPENMLPEIDPYFKRIKGYVK